MNNDQLKPNKQKQKRKLILRGSLGFTVGLILAVTSECIQLKLIWVPLIILPVVFAYVTVMWTMTENMENEDD